MDSITKEFEIAEFKRKLLDFEIRFSISDKITQQELAETKKYYLENMPAGTKVKLNELKDMIMENKSKYFSEIIEKFESIVKALENQATNNYCLYPFKNDDIDPLCDETLIDCGVGKYGLKFYFTLGTIPTDDELISECYIYFDSRNNSYIHFNEENNEDVPFSEFKKMCLKPYAFIVYALLSLKDKFNYPVDFVGEIKELKDLTSLLDSETIKDFEYMYQYFMEHVYSGL